MSVPGAGHSVKASAAAVSVDARPSWTAAWKTTSRPVKRLILAWRQAIADRAPPWLYRTVGPVVQRLDMLLIDHGIFRVLYLNKHRLCDHAWRSAQPAPHHLRALAHD